MNFKAALTKTMSSPEEADDLDTRPRKYKSLRKVQPEDKRSSSPLSISDASDHDLYGDEGRPRKKIRRTPEGATRLEWSDNDDENAGTSAYNKFKGRGGEARKKAIASTKRAKAVNAGTRQKSNKDEEGTTGVGRRAPKKKKARPIAAYDDVLSDEEGADYAMPDYVRDRRNRFDERAERLKAAGLALPPSYDDVCFSDNERIDDLEERPYLPNITPPAEYRDGELEYTLGVVPGSIRRYLRDYQFYGAAFLHELFVYQKGGILGDDMGLGKTIQVIAFLTAAYGKTGDERDNKRMRKMRKQNLWYPRILIICPGSLMANWQDELARWGWWHVQLFHGSPQARETALAQAKSGMLEVMITTYNTYRIYKDHINMVAWDCVIADECHIIKERKSEITKAMNQVNSLCRIGLTGTAIQNKYDELWTLLNWSSPGRFGSIVEWKQAVSEKLKDGQSHNATVHQLDLARRVAKTLVQKLLPQFFLRRMKSLIKDQLPKKTDRVVFCPLTEAQKDAYRTFIDSVMVGTIKTSAEFCDCGSKKKKGWCCYAKFENGDTWKEWVFPCIAYLQRISNHLALLSPSSHDEKKKGKDVELLQMAVPNNWKEFVEKRDSLENHSNPDFCGKWRVLRKLLRFWHEQGNNKVLVFSHSVRLLKMLQKLFVHTSYSVMYLDGSMSYEDRYAAVRDFNADPMAFVFLISTRAGGVGLNITSANKVVVVDPNWNPSYDLQAQDRAYRIGQTRDVEVFRLISQGTMEENIYARQIYKQQMSNIGLAATSERRYFTGIQDRPGQKGELFGLQNLFAYQEDNAVLRDIVHKTNVAEARADLQIAELDLENEDTRESSDQDDDDSDDPLVHNTKSSSEQKDREKEDAAMSQLVAEITGDTPKRSRNGTLNSNTITSTAGPVSNKRHDPVQAILASAGVSYTHENSEVIGSSRVEAALSKLAAEASGVHQREIRVFQSQSQSESKSPGEALLNGHSTDGDREFSYLYKPPEDVSKRQFCSMARWAEFAGDGNGVVEFALLVESWTQAERREFLEGWYRWRRECLVNGVKNDPIDEVEVKMETEEYDQDGQSGKVKEEVMSDDVKVKLEGDAVKVETNGALMHDAGVVILDSDDDGEL